MGQMDKFFYFIRDLRSKDMFTTLRRHCSGRVLDVGGGDFYQTARQSNFSFKSWINLEYLDIKPRVSALNIEKFRFVRGDGYRIPFKDESFDTVLNIQVLEHTFDPQSMVNEIARMLKPGGKAIFLIPQTSTLHLAPHHYYNFTRFWIEEAMRRAGLRIVEFKPIGGIWSSMASHLFYFFFQSIRYRGMSAVECKRKILFYCWYPLMVLYALVSIPICMLFGLGDLTEEPNNHLVVATRQ